MFHNLITRLTSKIKAIIMQPRINSNFVSGAKRGRKVNCALNVQVDINLNTPPEKTPLQMVDSLSPSLSL